jgi:hypothetical protein
MRFPHILAARHRRARLFAHLALSGLILLAGCSVLNDMLGPPPLRDARVELVQVDWGAPGRASERVPPLLRVAFSTDRDLTSFSREHGSTINVDAALCPTAVDDPPRRLSRSSLLAETGEPIAISRWTEPDATGRYLYRFYLDLPSRARDLGASEAFVDHDYRRSSDDICFYFRGGDMITTHRSRDFRIPYALIADALARARMPYAAVTPGS